MPKTADTKQSVRTRKATKTPRVAAKTISSKLADIPKPTMRPLKAYAFDPSAGKLLGNEMTMKVRFQNLEASPVVRDRGGDAIAVVDYDGANQTYYRPVDLNDARILIRGGLDPDEANPRFHQQMVYAVVTETIQHFEQALGRRIHWRRGHPQDNPGGWRKEHIWTLNLFPHAFIGPNAFYSPEAHGILFGYFRTDADSIGRNLPGQTVFTCLSHDVVVHETTHAVIDGIRTFFTEQTNPDVPAFHEAIADLAALFRHFTHGEVLRDTLERTGGALYKYQMKADAATSRDDQYAGNTDQSPLFSGQISQQNPLVGLAQQFGEATGKQKALREALGTKPNSDDIKIVMEPHARGSILVAAVFDAFFTMYVKRTADLWRIFRAGGGSDNPTDIPKPLADRLCEAAVNLAEQFFQICVRALDYCPPVDITFGGYLRALITADTDLRPRDEAGVRDALMQSFRLRGIIPEEAGFFSKVRGEGSKLLGAEGSAQKRSKLLFSVLHKGSKLQNSRRGQSFRKDQQGSKLLFSGSAQKESAQNRSKPPFSDMRPRSRSVGPEILVLLWSGHQACHRRHRSRSDGGPRGCLGFTEARSACRWSVDDRQPRDRRGHAWLICVRPRVSRTRNRQTPAGPDPLAGFARTPESGR